MIELVWLFVGMLGASASDQQFHYEKPEIVRLENDVCRLCYGLDCFVMDHLRCEYHKKADSMFYEPVRKKVDNPDMRNEVDSMLHELVKKGAALASECIPLISTYTDCQKENICTGCKTCKCDGSGRWNCNVVHKCRPDPTLDINHNVLVMVMENLMASDQKSRLKRAIQDKANVNETKLSYEEISGWLFGLQPLENLSRGANSNDSLFENDYSEVLTKSSGSLVQNVTDYLTVRLGTESNITDHDYLAFDEVLDAVAVESQNYTRKKLLSDAGNETFFDYMIMDEYSGTANDVSATVASVGTSNLFSERDFTSSHLNGITESVIDFLEASQKNNSTNNNNNKDYMDDTEQNNYIGSALENNNYNELNAVNIMKRDLGTKNGSQVQKLISTNKEYNTTTSEKIELRNDILIPLKNLIITKQKELEELLRVHENLIEFMKENDTKFETTGSKERDNETNIDPVFSIYKLEVVPEFDNAYDLRRTNTDEMQQMLNKLKRDVYEVITDFVTIQKLTNLTNLPLDLKMLIRAMKNYVHSRQKIEKNQDIGEIKPFRRNIGDENTQHRNIIIGALTDILETIAKSKPQSNALGPLSDSSMKVLKRVIIQNYESDFTPSGLRMRVVDKNYNLTNDLHSIGRNWEEIAKSVMETTLSNRLYAVKFLHILLSSDIEKMNDALALLNFAHSRRMFAIDGPIGNKLIDKINRGLEIINEKIKLVIKLHNKQIQPNTVTYKLHNKLKAESFFKKLKNVLKNSKRHIVNLVKRKGKNHDLVKELARKHRDDITRRRFTEFEETMKKWQSKLNLRAREKRSLKETKFRDRIKNILPKYLMGKVNPAIFSKGRKKMNSKQTEHISSHNKRNNINSATEVFQSNKPTDKT